jgi:hypothetical protein
LLRNESERVDTYGIVRVSFRLPQDVTVQQLRERAFAMARDAEVLRMTEISLEADSVTYARDVTVPLRHLAAESLEDAEAAMSSAGPRTFPRQGRPLWELTTIEHPDSAGRRALSVCAAVDHVITDGYSMALFRRGLEGLPVSPARRFSDWVSWQRNQYPTEYARRTAEREFWRRYLDGLPPDRAPTLPFCPNPTPPVSGVCHYRWRELQTSGTRLRAAARKARATPAVVVLASVAAAIAAVGGDTDVTLKVTSIGRLPEYQNVQGLFADDVPVRVRHQSLADAHHALEAARTGWLDVFDHLTAPWYYILGLHLGYEPPATRRAPQVLVNFIPWPVHVPSNRDLTLKRRPGSVTALELTVFGSKQGRFYFRCLHDPERFRPRGVEDFLTACEESLVRLAS